MNPLSPVTVAKWDYFWTQLIAWVLTSGLSILVNLVVGYVAWRAVNVVTAFVSRKAETSAPLVSGTAQLNAREQQIKTLAHMVGNLCRVLIVFIVGMMSLKAIGIDPTPIIASAGILGLAVGFGAQSLVKDMITGFFILLEGQLAIGDSVQIGALAGQVERMSLRLTTLRDANGAVHMIPNGGITNVTNFSKEWIRAIVEVGVDAQKDIGKVFGVIQETADQLHAEWGDRIIERPQVAGISTIDATTMTIKLLAKTKPFKQGEVQHELRRRLKEALQQAEIWPVVAPPAPPAQAEPAQPRRPRRIVKRTALVEKV
jgi:small conductance mechanosensitive channel